MHLFFVDESGTPAKPGNCSPDHVVIAGIIIPEETWRTIREKLVGLKREKAYRGEIKWRFFAPNNTEIENQTRDWQQERRDEFLDRLFRIISNHESLKLIACACKCSKAYEIGQIQCQEDIYFLTYKPLIERFQYFPRDLSRESGIRISGLIVADHRGSGDDTKMRAQHERLVRSDAQYTSTYTNFVEGLFFAPSHMSIGIQLADMVAGATWRKFERGDSKYFDRIAPSFRRRTDGTLAGYGLVKFPNNW